MNLYLTVLQEIVELLKDEIGIDKCVCLMKDAFVRCGIDLKISSKGTIRSTREFDNEDTYIVVLNTVRTILENKIGEKRTREIFKKAAKEVVSLI